MKIIITGAGGFIGRMLTEKVFDAYPVQSLVLMDRSFDAKPPLANALQSGDKQVRYVEGDLSDVDTRKAMLEGGVDVVFNIAALPGGAAEENPALSKAINLDATQALAEEAASIGNTPRFVFTSAIATLGAPMPDLVNDDTPNLPSMTYGTHKAMMELALADLHRRNLLDVVSVRLPGIVARPLGPSGLKSAFISNVFHALKAGESFVSPVSEAARFWLMSIECCVRNLVHAAKLDTQLMPKSRVVTLPAVQFTMQEMCAEICKQTGTPIANVSYDADEALEFLFGRFPDLETPAAEHAGFVHDGSLAQLVSSSLKTL